MVAAVVGVVGGVRLCQVLRLFGLRLFAGVLGQALMLWLPVCGRVSIMWNAFVVVVGCGLTRLWLIGWRRG